MAKVIIHATMTLDGYMADKDGGIDWMFDVEATDQGFCCFYLLYTIKK
ncbi:hypothetical protein [Bacillus sp. SD088]|nr:hypothetical protein [Bacillus sp. SD088]